MLTWLLVNPCPFCALSLRGLKVFLESTLTPMRRRVPGVHDAYDGSLRNLLLFTDKPDI